MSLTGVIFVVFFIVGCGMAFARHPVYGLLTYVSVLFIDPWTRWWGIGLLAEVRWSLWAAGATILALMLRGRAESVSPFLRQRVVWGLILFVTWLAVQSLWAIDPESHGQMLNYFLKYLLVAWMIYRCLDSEKHLRLFLWTYCAGCFYFGWIAYTSYAGGRFEGFTGSGFGEANVAALVLATGLFVAVALFLAGGWRQRAAIVGMVPFIVNGIVTTISRSGFLSTAIGGIAFNVFTPKRYRVKVGVLSLLGLALFLMLTNPIYWARIGTIKFQGEQVEGVDTGAGRLVIIQTQWQMFKGHPFGCGHMCTSALSPSYMDPGMLSAGARASHNTLMSMLVDQGILGGVFYVAMLLWILKTLRTLGRVLKDDASFLASVLPAVTAVFAALTVADMFVQYPKLEIRIWFMAVLMVMLRMSSQRGAGAPPP